MVWRGGAPRGRAAAPQQRREGLGGLVRGRLVVGATGSTPLVLHFNGPAKVEYEKSWGVPALRVAGRFPIFAYIDAARASFAPSFDCIVGRGADDAEPRGAGADADDADVEAWGAGADDAEPRAEEEEVAGALHLGPKALGEDVNDGNHFEGFEVVFEIGDINVLCLHQS